MDMERQQEEYEENCSVNEEGLFMKGEIEEETSVGEDEEEIINVVILKIKIINTNFYRKYTLKTQKIQTELNKSELCFCIK